MNHPRVNFHTVKGLKFFGGDNRDWIKISVTRLSNRPIDHRKSGRDLNRELCKVEKPTTFQFNEFLRGNPK